MIFNRSNTFLLALGLLAVLSPHPAASVSKKAGGRRTRSEDAAERRRLLEEREEAFAAANPYSIVDQEHRRAGSGSGTGSGHYGFYYPYSGSGTGSGTGKGKGSSKCGYPDERCCADPSHRCVPGYGCKFPADFMDPQEDDYTCVKCGEDGGPCCNIGCGEDSCESSCLPGNTCNLFKNTCEKCGGDGQPCCPGDVCIPGSTCDPINKICERCGAEVGDPCCSGESGDFCSGDSLACDKDTATCQNCGGSNQICCPGDVCIPGSTCDPINKICERCGAEVGDPCCSGESGDFCSGDSLACDKDTATCQNCGGSNQICCPGDVCIPGSTCDPINKICERCGVEVGDPCCSGESGDFCSGDSLACDKDTATCQNCGGSNQICCPGDVCIPGSTCDPINKICERCGVEAGDPCCSGESGDFCSNDSLACDKDTATCQECGGEDQICCPGDVCDLDTQACNTGTGKCEDCGNAVGAVCCSGAICPFDTSVPPTDTGLLCNANDNRCQECGDQGQVCCPLGKYDSQCKFDRECLNGICEDLGDVPDGCLLSNGSGPAKDYNEDFGCNVNSGDPLEDAQAANNLLCCKGCCLGQKGNGGGFNGDGTTFMFCTGNDKTACPL